MPETPEPDVIGVRDLDRLYRAQQELLKMDGDDLPPEVEERVSEIRGELATLLVDVGIEMYRENYDSEAE